MANKFHKDLIEADVHAIIGVAPYADIGARDIDVLFNTNPANVNKVVRVTDADGLGTIGYFILVSIAPSWESLGASLTDSFLELIDTPGTYSGEGDKVLRVNSAEDAVEFADSLLLKGQTSGVSLDLSSTLGAFRPNRLTTTERDALTALAGMTIFNTTELQLETYNGTNWIGDTASDSFLELNDTPSSYAGEGGKVVQVNSGATALEFGQNLNTTGTPTFAQLTIDNIFINGNTISTTNANGDLLLSPNGLGQIDADTSKIINVVDPTADQHAATKKYVDDQNLLLDTFLELTDTPSSYTGQGGKVVQVNSGATALEFGQDLTTSGDPTFGGLTVEGSVLFNNDVAANIAFKVKAALNQTANLFLFVDSTDTNDLFRVTNIGEVTIGAGLTVKTGADDVAGIIIVGNSPTQSSNLLRIVSSTAALFFSIEADGSLTHNGDAVFQSTTDSLTAFQILDTDGGTPIFNVDSINERVGIGTAAPAATLDLVGNVLITNDVAANVAFLIKGVASQTGDLIEIVNSALTVLFSIGAQGNAFFQNTTDSLSAFQILDVSGIPPIFKVDTLNGRVSINKTTPAVELDVVGDGAFLGNVLIKTDADATIGLIVQAFSLSQSGSLIEIKNSAGLVQLAFDSSGSILDQGGSIGNFGQILSSLNGGVDWIDNPAGNVSNTGTPLDNQLAIWTGNTTIEGDPQLTFDGVTLFAVQSEPVGDFPAPMSFANQFVTGINDNGGMTIFSPNNKIGHVVFGDTDNADRGRLQYDHTTDEMGFHTAGVKRMTLSNNGTFQITGAFKDTSGDQGASGELLSSTASGTNWIDQADLILKGTSWTSRDSAADEGWLGVTYGKGLFVAVANTGTGTRVMTSPDGVNWTTRTSAANNSWFCVTYGNGLFVAVATSGSGNRVMTSPDGITWTSRTSAADNNWRAVTYGNNLFVAVSETGALDRVMTSPDGITWTSRTTPNNNNWIGMTFGNGLFVAVSESGTGNRVMTSLDGITWTSRTTPADHGWVGVTYGNGLFVAVSFDGAGNRFMTSPDGITWTLRTPPAVLSWLAITYGDGLFVAVAISGTGNRVATSPDGIIWTSRVSAVDNSWFSVTYGNRLFVAVSNGGSGDRVMTSGKAEKNDIPDNNIIQGGLVNNLSLARLGTAVSVSSGKQVIIGVTDTTVGRTATIRTVDILAKHIFIIKDESGVASNPNPITIDTEGSETIDGLTSVQIKIPYGVVRLYSDGANLFSW